MAVNLCDLQTNYLQTNGFQLVLPRFPLVTYFAQNFTFPSLSLPNSPVATPFSKIQFPGDTLEFEPFTFSFIVDDRMQNYKEIYNWLYAIGNAESYDNFRNFNNREKIDKMQRLGEQDATVSILSAKSNPTGHVLFRDAFPISLSGAEFSTQGTSTDYVMATATFAYTLFEFTP
jgi:hypothetical protein